MTNKKALYCSLPYVIGYVTGTAVATLNAHGPVSILAMTALIVVGAIAGGLARHMKAAQ